MMKQWIYAGTVALAAICAQPVVAQQELTLHNADGKEMKVALRKALPVSAERVRYPGFKQETLVLKAGSIRREGAKPLSCDILLERDVPIRLRDGVTIYADVFRPVGNDVCPAILAWSPYGKEIGGQMLDDVPLRSGVPLDATSGLEKFEGPDPAYWVAHGYAVVNPDKRGAYMSEGNLLYWGHEDALDGCDVIEWIASQKWCNGKVGMSGNSWLTVSQWFIAAERPEHLAAIAPWEGFCDHYRESGTRGGIPMPEFPEMIAETFSSAHGMLEDQPRMIVEKPFLCDYWLDKAARVENIDIPAYVVASYTNSVHTHGTFAGYRRMASKEKWLRVHNTNEWFDYYTPENVDDLRRFFDHYLKGMDNGWEKTPKVRLSVLNPGGRDIVGRAEDEFPLAHTVYRKLYLSAADSTLQASLPQQEITDIYQSAAKDNKVTYRYRMDKPTEITGYMKLHLWVSAPDHDDMDLAVRVEKLSKDGQPLPDRAGNRIVATGQLRVSLRQLDTLRTTEAEPYYTFTGEQKLKPGEIVPVEIEIWPMGLFFEKGEILQLTVGAYQPEKAAIPFGSAKITVPEERFTYMPGQPVKMMTLGGDATECADPSEVVTSPATHNVGRHCIYTGGRYDSYLYIPEIPAK
ncbi:CocE/NonD family hydrolase [Mediterranea massiliensis]|uniref:CocE/NonD family hydrolase n=1 Tax=Mediterranea massiliensis TaxID=1841865 RepID=UPI0025A3F9D3|nr:CocE/NonD family hydrolase [Mediterranea massiliensis]MDM8338398.1 CocE/NonD family hydrolase [Mediterranea massiliensis]